VRESAIVTLNKQSIIRWRYQRDGVVHNAIGLLVQDQGDQLQVRLMRDGVVTDRMVSIPKQHAIVDQAVVADERTLKERFKFGAPSDAQLTKINQYLPNGASSLTAEQIVTVPFVAADNLINRSFDKWEIDSLATMAQLLPGLPALLDHDWDDTAKEWGRIYSAELVRSRTAPDKAVNRAGNNDTNRQIVNKEGFAQVVFEVFAPVESPVVRALRRGHSGSISTGGFRFGDYWCPECDTSFSNPKCPHIPPSPWWPPGSDDDIAPYAIRVGLFDLGEASIVAIPNLPNAGVI
jgi:hypothetical protein